MNNVRTILIWVMLLAFSPASALAQSGHHLYQQALMQERTYGNLEGAIQLYERIALEFAEDRALTATALVNLGGAREKLGAPGALDAYRRVVEEFPDQDGQARQARARLEALLGSTEAERSVGTSQEPTYTLLLDEPPGSHFLFGRRFDLSPDGQQMVLASADYGPPGIYLVERLGDRPRLIRKFEVGRRNGYPRWSPDGSMIAIMSTEEPGAHIIDREGTLKAVVAFSHVPNDLSWNPDQQGLTYAPRGEDVAGVRSVTLDGQETVLAETTYGATNLAGYSPDGRWIAFQVGGWRLQVIPAAGGEVKRTPQSSLAGKIPGVPREPAWGPDGFLYFLPQSDGTQNVWRIKIDPQDGEAVGDPEQVTFYKDAVIRDFDVVPETGTIAYILRRTRNTVWLAPSNEPESPRALARGRQPKFSPDGLQVFFRGEGPGNDAVFSVPASGGTPVRLTPESHSVRGHQLVPDGSRVMYEAIVGGPPAEGMYFHVAATGGEPVRLAVPSGLYSPPAISPDGSTLAYAHEDGVYTVPFVGGEPTLLAELAGLEVVTWSPDGQYLAAKGWESATDVYQVYVLSLDGGEPRRLVTEDADNTEAGIGWHPDSQRLSFIRKNATWVAYLDGRPSTLLYEEPDLEVWIGQWAPDGETFYASGFDSSGPAVYRRNPDGTSELVCDLAWEPSLSADGRTLVWARGSRSSEMWLLEGVR